MDASKTVAVRTHLFQDLLLVNKGVVRQRGKKVHVLRHGVKRLQPVAYPRRSTSFAIASSSSNSSSSSSPTPRTFRARWSSRVQLGYDALVADHIQDWMADLAVDGVVRKCTILVGKVGSSSVEVELDIDTVAAALHLPALPPALATKLQPMLDLSSGRPCWELFECRTPAISPQGSEAAGSTADADGAKESVELVFPESEDDIQRILSEDSKIMENMPPGRNRNNLTSGMSEKLKKQLAEDSLSKALGGEEELEVPQLEDREPEDPRESPFSYLSDLDAEDDDEMRHWKAYLNGTLQAGTTDMTDGVQNIQDLKRETLENPGTEGGSVFSNFDFEVSEEERQAQIEEIRRNLKPGQRLVIDWKGDPLIINPGDKGLGF